MFRVTDRGGYTFTLSSYQARGNDTFNAKIEVHIVVGKHTPTHLNWFTCGYATLRDATTALRRQWEIAKRKLI